MRKYLFDWSLIGDIAEGRPHLGSSVDVALYRLMQFTLRDILEQKLGHEETDKIFYDAGNLAGKNFYEHFIQPVSTFEEFVEKAQRILKEKKIGLLRIEEDDLANGKVVLTVDEDLDCAGLPELDYEICCYDEGFITALFECFSQIQWRAKEIDCWCTGSRTCRFLVTQSS
jgi:predicted hydrocarbon binding protein